MVIGNLPLIVNLLVIQAFTIMVNPLIVMVNPRSQDIKSDNVEVDIQSLCLTCKPIYMYSHRMLNNARCVLLCRSIFKVLVLRSNYSNATRTWFDDSSQSAKHLCTNEILFVNHTLMPSPRR